MRGHERWRFKALRPLLEQPPYFPGVQIIDGMALEEDFVIDIDDVVLAGPCGDCILVGYDEGGQVSLVLAEDDRLFNVFAFC